MTTLLTLVKHTTKSIQLLKSNCKLHKAVVFKKSRIQCVRCCWCCWCGAAGEQAALGSVYCAHRCGDHGASCAQKPLFARCHLQRLVARDARRHAHTRTRARATRVRPLLSASTRHLKAHRLVSGDTRTHACGFMPQHTSGSYQIKGVFTIKAPESAGLTGEGVGVGGLPVHFITTITHAAPHRLLIIREISKGDIGSSGQSCG